LARISKPAAPPISKPAGAGQFPNAGISSSPAGWEARHTKDLEIGGTGLRIITILVRIALFFAIFDSSRSFFF
jgi:hypothetical protein